MRHAAKPFVVSSLLLQKRASMCCYDAAGKTQPNYVHRLALLNSNMRTRDLELPTQHRQIVATELSWRFCKHRQQSCKLEAAATDSNEVKKSTGQIRTKLKLSKAENVRTGNSSNSETSCTHFPARNLRLESHKKLPSLSNIRRPVNPKP